MPLIVCGDRVPPRWAERSNRRRVPPIGETHPGESTCITVGLINNMPDSALEDTELQFFDLLDRASGKTAVFIRLYALSGVPRSDRSQPHLKRFYVGLEQLWERPVDALIVTGTEPQRADLREEPYWGELVDVFDWAQGNTISIVLSCLAAHAGVLHSDGIQRHRLDDKRFGVFEARKVHDHALTAAISEPILFPHSRWNDLDAHELGECDYSVLTYSDQAGVDTFVKKKQKSLFVHFQGHPEYVAHTLLKEYRRDIKRFLKGERDTYPSTPQGYFDPQASTRLAVFKQRAARDRRESCIAHFPQEVVERVQSTWRASAISVYCNWLQYIISQKGEVAAFTSMARAYEGSGQARAAMLH